MSGLLPGLRQLLGLDAAPAVTSTTEAGRVAATDLSPGDGGIISPRDSAIPEDDASEGSGSVLESASLGTGATQDGLGGTSLGSGVAMESLGDTATGGGAIDLGGGPDAGIVVGDTDDQGATVADSLSFRVGASQDPQGGTEGGDEPDSGPEGQDPDGTGSGQDPQTGEPTTLFDLDPAAMSEIQSGGTTSVLEGDALSSRASQDPQGGTEGGDEPKGGTEGQEPEGPETQGGEIIIHDARSLDDVESSTLLDGDGGGLMADAPQLDFDDLTRAGEAIELGDVLEP